MPRTNNIPHVLIAADPIFALHLWELCPLGEKPVLLSTNPIEIYSLCRSLKEKPEVIGSSFSGLIEHLVYNEDNDEPVAELRTCLREVREKCSLSETARLSIAMAGSHSSLSGTIDGAGFHFGDYEASTSRPRFQNAMRSGRTLIGLLDKAIAEFGEFQSMWLADAFPQLQPNYACGNYLQLAQRARIILRKMTIPPFGAQGIQIRNPSIPLIFVTRNPIPAGSNDHPVEDWQLFKFDSRQHNYSVTQLLINQFDEQRKGDPSLRGVLVKLLPDDLSDQNALDAPIVGEETVEAARRVGLEAILLDAKRGILRPPAASNCITNALVLGI